MHIRNTKVKDEATAQKMDEMFRVAFSEDKSILEAVQVEEEKPQNSTQLQLAIDQACIAYRARIKELSEAELGN